MRAQCNDMCLRMSLFPSGQVCGIPYDWGNKFDVVVLPSSFAYGTSPLSCNANQHSLYDIAAMWNHVVVRNSVNEVILKLIR